MLEGAHLEVRNGMEPLVPTGAQMTALLLFWSWCFLTLVVLAGAGETVDRYPPIESDG